MSDLRSKIRSMLRRPTLSALATTTADGKPWVRYVTATMDDDLVVRIATFAGSRKAAQIRDNPEVHLTCGVASLANAKDYLQIQGRAEVTRDEAERRAVWAGFLGRFFSGPDDPNLAVIVVRPYRIEYQVMGRSEPEVWTG